MLALGLTLGLFALWFLVGLALLALLRYPGDRLQNMLLAPAAGLAAVLLAVFLLSRAGFPQAVISRPLALAFVIGSAIVVWRFRPTLAVRAYMAFLGVLVVALVATAWPMLEFGFDWISYSNDDMANYTLAAQRIVNYGFFDIPPASDFVAGRDYSLSYWFFNLGVRPGAEMLTAWVSALTSLYTHQAFMPLIMALHLVMISAAGALACQSERFRTAALVGCALLAASAMASLGALYQLIGQVGGLALLAGCSTVLMRRFVGTAPGMLIRQGLTIALLGAGLFVMYPEVVPFLGLSWLAFVGLALVRREQPPLTLAAVLAVAVVAGAVVLNTYAFTSLGFLSGQAAAGLAKVNLDIALFPYFLLPSGLAALWGFQNMVKLTGEPWLSTSIVLGAGILVIAGWAAVRGSWRLQPAACISTVMLVLAVDLFVQRSDFGLFKLAMYVQPFLLPTLVIAWFSIPRQRVLQVAPLVVGGVIGLWAQSAYVERSRGYLEGTGGGLTEIPNASGSRINTEFRGLLDSIGPHPLVLDTSNVVLAKFQAEYLGGRQSTFPTQDFFNNITNANFDLGLLFNPKIEVAANELRAERKQRFATLEFDMHDPQKPELRNPFTTDTHGQPPEVDPAATMLVQTTPQQTLLNRWSASAVPPSGDFTVRPWSEVTNHLIFKTSDLGQPYYTADRKHVALYQLEPDAYYPSETMGGVGRYFLFQVVNPSPTVRVVLDMTDTLAADGVNELPPAAAVGTTREPFSIVGRGSARVFSPPITPQVVDGRSYISIDMGSDGETFPMSRTGLMNVFGGDVAMDIRRLVGFGRDISVVSEDEYSRLTIPTSLDSFPSALANPQLQYSGIYEDGWLSDRVSVLLQESEPAMMLRLRGEVPDLANSSGSSELQIVVDGTELGQRSLSPGAFDIKVPVTGNPGVRHVRLEFANPMRLPGQDRRIVGAHLDSVGFEPDPQRLASNSATDVLNAQDGLTLGSGWFQVESSSDESFRWVDNDAEIRLEHGSTEQVPLRVDLAPGPGVGTQPMLLDVSDDTGAKLLTRRISARESLVVPLRPSQGHPVVLRLHVSGGGLPTPGDPRVLNFRVFHIGWAGSGEGYDAATLLRLNSSGSSDVEPIAGPEQLRDGAAITDGLLLGHGWYQLEQASGTSFRWVSNDAEFLVMGATSTQQRVRIDLEPGPAADSHPLLLTLVDEAGRILTRMSIDKRETQVLDVPTHPGMNTVFRLHADGGEASAPNDNRVLNFRVFSITLDSP